jgi:hypothetical protein
MTLFVFDEPVVNGVIDEKPPHRSEVSTGSTGQDELDPRLTIRGQQKGDQHNAGRLFEDWSYLLPKPL